MWRFVILLHVFFCAAFALGACESSHNSSPFADTDWTDTDWIEGEVDEKEIVELEKEFEDQEKEEQEENGDITPQPCSQLENETGVFVCSHKLADDAAFNQVAVDDNVRPAIASFTKYLIPLNKSYVPVTFQNLRHLPSRLDFLSKAFPAYYGWLTSENYSSLFLEEKSRQYLVGSVLKFSETCKGHAYGFTLEQRFSNQNENPGKLDENLLASVRQQLGDVLPEEAPLFFPVTNRDRQASESWNQDLVDVYDCEVPSETEIYTAGVSVGYVRILSDRGRRKGDDFDDYGWQEIIVSENALDELDDPVAGVVTQERQTMFSEPGLLAAQNGIPNLFLNDALERFSPYEDQFVKVSVESDGNVTLENITVDKAQLYWEASRPESPEIIVPDQETFELPSLLEMHVDNAEEREQALSRFGGRGTTLAIGSQNVASKHRTQGVVVPFAYYLEFLQTNEIVAEIDGVTESRSYREHVLAMTDQPEFSTDPAFRREQLEEFSEHMQRHGDIERERIQALSSRISEVFGNGRNTLRFDSSSNLDTLPEFSDETLVASPSACEDDRHPSACTGESNDPQAIENALRILWADFWEPESFEKRWFHRIVDPDRAAVAVVITKECHDLDAHGMIFSGLPQTAGDERMVAYTQIGNTTQESVDSAESPESVLMTVEEETTTLYRGGLSSLVEPSEVVLDDETYIELATNLDNLRQEFPFDFTSYSTQEAVLALEFEKAENDEALFVRAIPLQRKEKDSAINQVTIEIDDDTTLCGRFRDNRDLFEEYRLRTKVELQGETFELPTSGPLPEQDIIKRVIFGPQKTELVAMDSPQWHLDTADPGDGKLYYRYRFEQTFTDGEQEFHLGWEKRTTGALHQRPETIQISEKQLETFSNGWSLQAVSEEREQTISLLSCHFDNLPRFKRTAWLPSGERIELDVRFQESLLSSGPAALLGASWFRTEDDIHVNDYFRLVYSADHHNWKERFLVVFPDCVEGIRGVAIRESYPFDPSATKIEWLDDSFEVLESLTPTQYIIEETGR